jgi:hypothetical protein
LDIDPLLRNIENCDNIEPILMFSNNRRRECFAQKVLAYADDISVITKTNSNSIQAIFEQYEKLSNLSGLTLNADKTEIINTLPGNNVTRVKYNNSFFNITPLESIIICGIKLANDEQREYEYNVLRRITEMENQLKKWLCRDLTLNGRNIIAKTFGMSQLIYTFQCCEVKEKELKEIECLYFKFLWSKKWDKRSPDRIKRAILKNTKSQGGLNCMDVKALYQALAVRNILQATRQPDKFGMQAWLNNMIGLTTTTQEMEEMSLYDPITKTAQIAINQLTSYLRQNNFCIEHGEIQTKILEQALNTNLQKFAKINNYPILRQQLARIPQVKTLKDLIENMTGNNINLFDNTFSLLPHSFKNLKEFYNADLTLPTQLHFIHEGKAIAADKIKSSQLQSILKIANKKIATPEISRKYDTAINCQNNEIFSNLYSKIKDPKLRAIQYRILQGDVFSKDRMLKFKMADDDKCERCGETETKQHQLYECLYAKRMWRHYNKTMRRIGLSDIQINSLNQAIIPSKNGNYLSETMRVIVLKANIQIVRPKHNLPEVLDSLFSAQAKIENNVYNRKLSKANKRTKIGQKNSSLWYKLLISLGKS